MERKEVSLFQGNSVRTRLLALHSDLLSSFNAHQEKGQGMYETDILCRQLKSLTANTP